MNFKSTDANLILRQADYKTRSILKNRMTNDHECRAGWGGGCPELCDVCLKTYGVHGGGHCALLLLESACRERCDEGRGIAAQLHVCMVCVVCVKCLTEMGIVGDFLLDRDCRLACPYFSPGKGQLRRMRLDGSGLAYMNPAAP